MTKTDDVTLVLVDEGEFVKHGRWGDRKTRVGRVWDVFMGGKRIGAIERRMFTRERRVEGRRYVEARWQSPGWGVPHSEPGGLWRREFYTKKEAVQAIVDMAGNNS